MKKLLSCTLALVLLFSCLWTTVSAESDIRKSGLASNQGTVRITATPGNEITVTFNLQQCDKAGGFLCEMKYTRSKLSYIDYTQYYSDSFVNQVNNSNMMFSVLFDAAGTSFADETPIIAFKFKSNSNISADDVCITYTIKEFYNADQFEMSYDSVVVKADNESSDTEQGPHIHTPIVHDAKAPTCTESGWGEWAECKDCGEIIIPKIDIPATGHTEVKDPAVEATCTSEGKTEGIHCSVCGAVIKAQETIPKKEHNYVNGVCTMCGKKKEGYSTDSEKHSDSDTSTDTPSGEIYGDVSGDGKVTSKDSLIILRASINMLKLTDKQKKIADVNDDGRANTTDALIIQRYSIGAKSKNSRIGQKYA